MPATVSLGSHAFDCFESSTIAGSSPSYTTPSTMHSVSLAVLLTTVVMAQADELSATLNVPAHKQHLYIFEVTSEASVGDLKAALRNFTIDASYQVIGERKFFFSFISDDKAALRSLAFPPRSVVRQHAVEHVDQFLELFHAGSGMQEDYPEKKAGDGVLFYLELEQNLPNTMCSRTFDLEIREWAIEFRKVHALIRPHMYVIIGSFPPRWMQFISIEENALQHLLKKGTTESGSFAADYSSVKRIIRV